jgi:N-acetylglutamate synthase-like GNAT family acetyltransferase
VESPVLKIINYEQHHQLWFEKLNRAWIEQYFWMEPIDFDVLQHPDKHIIETGGHILMAQLGNEIIGTVALKFVEPGVYEFTKMAVDENFRGQKAGLKLSLGAIDKARELQAHKIILYSNTVLNTAIQLYKRLGFIEVPLDGPYKRSNIKMELPLA